MNTAKRINEINVSADAIAYLEDRIEHSEVLGNGNHYPTSNFEDIFQRIPKELRLDFRAALDNAAREFLTPLLKAMRTKLAADMLTAIGQASCDKALNHDPDKG